MFSRYWPISHNGVYVLENLSPASVMDLRFAAKNRIGFSDWAASMQVETLARGPNIGIFGYICARVETLAGGPNIWIFG